MLQTFIPVYYIPYISIDSINLEKYESISWSNVHPVKVFDYFVFIRSYDGKFINTVGYLKADGWIPFQNKEKNEFHID